MQVPAFMIIGKKMHERARCLWRGNLLRIENRSPSLAWLSPPSALAKTAERRVAGKKRKGRKCRGRRKSRPKRTGEGGCRGKALAHWGDWVSGWLRKLAKKAERKGQAPVARGAVSMATPAAACTGRWLAPSAGPRLPPHGYPAR